VSEARRKQANRLGHGAEFLAAIALRLKGYSILARGYRVPAGEIDIVARRGRLIAFVEGKARASLAGALDAVGNNQRRRIVRAAEHFMAHHANLHGCDLRFDVMAVRAGRWPTHVADAWRP